MNQINQIILEGNAVDKPTVKDVMGNKVGTFTIAVNCYYRSADGESVNETSYFDCVCYGMIADTFANKIVKGRGVRIVGRLEQERWTTSDGKECSKVIVLCEHIELKPMYNKEA